jgi:hypothetical protein
MKPKICVTEITARNRTVKPKIWKIVENSGAIMESLYVALLLKPFEQEFHYSSNLLP